MTCPKCGSENMRGGEISADMPTWYGRRYVTEVHDCIDCGHSVEITRVYDPGERGLELVLETIKEN